MYKIEIAPEAQKELKKIKKQYHTNAVKEALEEIADEPFSGKPLINELTGQFSYRVGVYRIIYKVNKQNKTIYILNAGHRATVYQ